MHQGIPRMALRHGTSISTSFPGLRFAVLGMKTEMRPAAATAVVARDDYIEDSSLYH